MYGTFCSAFCADQIAVTYRKDGNVKYFIKCFTADMTCCNGTPTVFLGKTKCGAPKEEPFQKRRCLLSWCH